MASGGSSGQPGARRRTSYPRGAFRTFGKSFSTSVAHDAYPARAWSLLRLRSAR